LSTSSAARNKKPSFILEWNVALNSFPEIDLVEKQETYKRPFSPFENEQEYPKDEDNSL
jgi:hypothetical protein